MDVLGQPFELGQGSYTTYPHCNGFADGGRLLVYTRICSQCIELRGLELGTGKIFTIEEIPFQGQTPPLLWFDVALEAPLLAAAFDNKVWLLNLVKPSGWRCLYEVAPPNKLHGLVSIKADGSRIVCGVTQTDSYAAVEVDTGTGEHRQLFSQSWLANHFHYCPYDEAWVGFSHEGRTEEVSDRCWAWHAGKAPQGIPVFDQHSEQDGKPLCIGHERWCFHGLSAYAVAYAVSPAGKRGLYEVYADRKPGCLLWESDVVWHCNMDRTGRFAVIDTSGPWADAEMSEADFITYRDQHVKADMDKTTIESDIVLLDLKKRKSLLLATARRSQHPYHPHPAISLDGKWVAWTDLSRGACLLPVSFDDC